MAQSILVNSGIASAGRLVTLVLGLVATALITRLLGAGAFGQYSFVATIGIFLQLVADFGLYLTASRELGRGEGRGMQFGHIMSLRGVFLLLVYGAGGMLFFTIPSLRPFFLLFMVFAAGFVMQSLSQLLMSVFQAYGVVWRATISDIAGRVVQVVLLLIFYERMFKGSAPTIAVAGAFSAGLLIACCMQFFLIPHKKLLIPYISPSAWKKIIRVSFPIGALLVLNSIYFRIDTVMLVFFRTTQEVGWYALAYRVVEDTLFFPAMLGGLMLPHISSAIQHKDHVQARGFIEQALLLSLSLALPIVALLVFFASPIVIAISGQAFSASGPILAVLAWAAGIMFVGNILGFALIALHRQRDLLTLYAVLVVGNVGANFVYIPQYGAMGAAWVTVLTEGIATAVASFLVYKHIPWRISALHMYRIIIAITIAIGAGLLLPASVPFAGRIVCICAVYVILGYTIGIWSKSTTSLLRSAKGV